MTNIIEAKRIDGKPAYRVEGTPEGAWRVAASDIDAIINHVTRELGIKSGALLLAIGIDPSSISRCRKGGMPIQETWLLRLHQFSGVPVAEMLRVACVEQSVWPHRNARIST
jgi:hypothetical protein